MKHWVLPSFVKQAQDRCKNNLDETLGSASFVKQAQDQCKNNLDDETLGVCPAL